ncbi:unnamed protein product [Urochloa humidicola]
MRQWSLYAVCGEALTFCAFDPPVATPVVLPGATLDVAAGTSDPSALDSDPAARVHYQASRAGAMSLRLTGGAPHGWSPMLQASRTRVGQIFEVSVMNHIMMQLRGLTCVVYR